MKMERSLEGVCLDMPARIGATVFGKGTPVYEVIERAQAEYAYHNTHKTDPEPVDAHKRATDPWITEIYAIVRKQPVIINDLLEAAMAKSVFDVSEEDRGWFMQRVKERQAK